eukprot:TRINITY_DN614_c0_g1_i1.p1 TRINITY_DN614_c0_g1~~TRINITY_DN614_c0_g1_i1.p1  ORF type:complete len:1209 (+),score=341.45 TRINITY_DN614_c0_g1_i1:157-3627(+)
MSSKRKHRNSTDGQKQDNKEVNVQVVVRCRPLNSMERREKAHSVVQCVEENKEIRLQHLKQAKCYNFDTVYGPASTQKKVFDTTVAPIVDEVLKGFNCTVFAYGVTGTGKTYTMEGRRDTTQPGNPYWSGEHAGVIPRATKMIFDHLESTATEYTVRVSYLELYNEELIDLLSPDDHNKQMRMFDGAVQGKGVMVQGLEEVIVHNAEDIFSVLERSSHKRQVAETNLNKASSRSHCVFTVIIHTKEVIDGEELLKVGKLNLVDLAGSENVQRSGAMNERRREAGMINQSLLTLGRVINALTERSPHVPYRESKLTRLLQESLGGRAKTCIIATVSGSSASIDETLSTLEYANKSKNIRNKPQVNQKMTKKALIREYTQEIEKLKQDLFATRSKNGVYVNAEKFYAMEQMIQSQQGSATEMEGQISQFQDEIKKIQQMFNQTKKELECSREQHTVTKHVLKETEEVLEITKDTLETTEQHLEEHQTIVKEQVVTEEQLTGEAHGVLSTLKETVQDVGGLFGKIDRKVAVHDANQDHSRAFVDKLVDHVERMQTQQDTFQQEHMYTVVALRRSVTEMSATKEQEIAALTNEIKQLRAQLSERKEAIHTSLTEEGEFVNSVMEGEKDHLIAFDGAMRDRMAENDKQVTHQVELVHQDLSSQQTDMCAWEGAMCASLDRSVACATDFHLQQNTQLDALRVCVGSMVGQGIGRLEKDAATMQTFASEQDKKAKEFEATMKAQMASLLSSFLSDQQSHLTAAMEDMREGGQQRRKELNTFAGAFESTVDEMRTSVEGMQSEVSSLATEQTGMTNNGREHADHMATTATIAVKSVHDMTSEHASEHTSSVSAYSGGVTTRNASAVADLSTRQSTIATMVSDMHTTAATSLDDHSLTLTSVYESIKTHTDNWSEELEGNTLHTAEAVAGCMQHLEETKEIARTYITNIKQDVPTGTTPQKKQHRLPSHFSRTRPHADIVAELRGIAPAALADDDNSDLDALQTSDTLLDAVRVSDDSVDGEEEEEDEVVVVAATGIRRSNSINTSAATATTTTSTNASSSTLSRSNTNGLSKTSSMSASCSTATKGSNPNPVKGSQGDESRIKRSAVRSTSTTTSTSSTTTNRSTRTKAGQTRIRAPRTVAKRSLQPQIKRSSAGPLSDVTNSK